jgi:two-component system, NarL family, sensor histidine kinase UhpB
LKKVTVVFFLAFCCVTSTFAQNPRIDSLLQVKERHSKDTVGIEALLNLTNELLRIDMEKAKEFVLEAIPLADSLHYTRGLSNSYHYMVIIHQSLAQPDSAIYFLNMLEKLAADNPSQPKLRGNFNQSAGLFYKNQGNYKKALPYQLENLKILTEESENQAGLFLNIGNTYFVLSDYTNAMHYHLNALRVFEKVGSKRGQSFTLQSLGNDFLHLNQYEVAKKYHLQSMKLKEELNDKRGLLTTWTSLADVYKESQQFSLAEDYYLKAINGAQAMKLAGDELRGFYQLGLLYKQMGDYPRAMESLSKSLELAREVGDSTLSAKTTSELIGIDLEKQQAGSDESTLISNLNTVKESGDRRSELTEYGRLIQYYAQKKQFEKAFEYQKKYELLKEEIEGTAVLLELKELEAQYQSEKKEKEIELLKKDQELQSLALERERANVVIIGIVLASVILVGFLLINRYRAMSKAKRQIEMERMRNSIARDLHDDIGSTLSSINIISQIALKSGDRQSVQYFQSIHEHSSKIMESMSDIVWSINPNNDSLEQVLVKMKEFAAEILEPKGIAISFQGIDEVKNIELASEKRKNVFLIFKEAINNAARYSNASKIVINVAGQNGNIIFSISDNGNGFDPEKVKPGNGLKNMEARAKSLLGALSRTSAIGNGTHINLEFPIT